MADSNALLETRRAEALALFEANQAARSAAERTATATILLAGAGATTWAATRDIDVAIPFPALFLLLISFMCQQYSDLTVLGMARRRLEWLVNRELGSLALVYETAVAPIRKSWPGGTGPFVGLPILQALAVGLPTLAFAVVGAIAVLDETIWVILGFWSVTALAAGSCGRSYVEMLKTDDWAAAKIKRSFADPELWLVNPDPPDERPGVYSGSDGTRTRDLRRDRPAL